MPKEIFKSIMRRRGSNIIEVPRGSKPVKVLYNSMLENMTVWYEFYTGNDKNLKKVRIDLVGDGQPVGDEYIYIDSIEDGMYIWHVYWSYP